MTNGAILQQLLHLVDNHAQQGGVGIVGRCRQCGEPLRRKSKNGRLPEFCSSACRVKHWRAGKRATNGRLPT